MARITRGNPLTPGMKRFSEEQMRSLYGSREQYEQQVNAKLDDMVRNRWVLPQDAPLMFSRQISDYR